ncbi:Heat shock protein 70 family [Trinorchestia longiramus]|nr:Heat shock protein 70 family [Trinorchestia longiramus]
MSRSVAVGIDLGTTYSCVGVWRGRHPEIIADSATGSRLTPSAVAFADEVLYVGESSLAQAAVNPENTIYETKRLIGRKFSDRDVVRDRELLPYAVQADHQDCPLICVSYKGEELLLWPEQVAALVLGKLKKMTEEFLECEVTEAVITVPAYFSDSQRHATKDAARIAGISVLRIINEPTAAAMAYGLHRNITGEMTILVYDLGGGTFDVSLLKIIKNDNLPTKYVVKAVSGDTNLGGTNFDKLLVEYCLQDIRQRFYVDLSGDQRALIRLKKECESVKRRISVQLRSEIDVPGLINGHDYSCVITRSRFEHLCENLFFKTKQIVRQLLTESHTEVADVEEVVLVGGSTRIPKIQSMLAEMFNKSKIRQTINPDEAVASGAAILAAVLSGDNTIDDVKVCDVIPLSLGLADSDQQMVVVMDKNTTIPAKVVQPSWTTVADYQRRCRFKVYEGEYPSVKDNLLLGSFVLEDIAAARKGMPKLAVTFSVDDDGILSVHAVETRTGHNKIVQIGSRKGRLTLDDINSMAATHSRYMIEELVHDSDDEESEEDEEGEEEMKNLDGTKEQTRQLDMARPKERLQTFCMRSKLLFGCVSGSDTISDRERQGALQACVDLLEWLDDTQPRPSECFNKLQEIREEFEPLFGQLAYYK